VRSTLTIGMNITPRAAQLGTPITFQARSPRASFYEWNAGDGSPSINGTSDTFQYTYKKTGVYQATLRVKNSDGSEENTMTRSIYMTDTDSPFALISISNGANTVVENPNGCEGNTGSTFVINRSDSTLIDGGKSINVDGNSA
jgi:PKD repeat protein